VGGGGREGEGGSVWGEGKCVHHCCFSHHCAHYYTNLCKSALYSSLDSSSTESSGEFNDEISDVRHTAIEPAEVETTSEYERKR
jgi:hypothetical protein